jgi:hypothetical protein
LLRELSNVMQLPTQAVEWLATGDTSEATWHEPVSGTARWKAAMTTVEAGPEPAWLIAVRRWQWLLPALICLQFVVCALLEALHQPTALTENLVGYVVLGSIAGFATAWRYRQAGGPQPTERANSVPD